MRNYHPVNVICPFTNVTETVYFFPVEKNGKFYMQFNGCNNNWRNCEECNTCCQAAFTKLPSEPFPGPQFYTA